MVKQDTLALGWPLSERVCILRMHVGALGCRIHTCYGFRTGAFQLATKKHLDPLAIWFFRVNAWLPQRPEAPVRNTGFATEAHVPGLRKHHEGEEPWRRKHPGLRL